MSDSSTSSRWAAMATICLRRIVPASLTAPAVIGPLRLPWVPAPYGVTAVSPWIVDVGDVGAQRVGGQLDHRRLDAVAGRSSVDVDVDLAGRLHPDRRTLGAEVPGRGTGRFDVGREPQPDVAAGVQRVLLLLAESLVVEDFDGLLERIRGCDVLIGHAVGVEVRHLVATQNVSAAQFDGVHVHLSRRDVEKYFAGEGFVLPWTAVGGQPAVLENTVL